MRKCPACGSWTLGFDEYFGRFRCFHPACSWMPSSSAEREISLMEKHIQLRLVHESELRELGLKLTASYDSESDALVFDFGLDEPSYDLPEPDGRMIWRIGQQTETVIGFSILGAVRWGVSEVRIDIAARIECIKHSLERLQGGFSAGRATRVLIDSIAVTAHTFEHPQRESDRQMSYALSEAFSKFESHFLKEDIQTTGQSCT